jgi:glycosyltransferase involved in cell wall biosynthesis
VLPLGFDIPAQLTRLSPEDRRALRRRLGLPDDRPLVLSAAALNRSHKRLDYLIEELAAVSAPRPFLLMAGEPDDETPEIGALARARLGPEGFAIRTVPTGEMPDLYRTSDVFVLASLVEMQGRALIEAAGHGVPCIAHDSPVMTFALGESGVYADFTQPGALTALLARPALPDGDARRAAGIHWHVYERFSWARLRARYVELFVRVASQNSTVSSSTGE